MTIPAHPSDPPPFIEALAVWGWAVQYGGIPLAYAARALGDHPCYLKDSGVPDPTPEERAAWAAEDLSTWEDLLVHIEWPGDDAFDRERWDQPADWELREHLLQHYGRSSEAETTDALLLRYCEERIAECNRGLAEQDADDDTAR